MMDNIIDKEYGSANYSRTMSFGCIDAIKISLFIEKESLCFYSKAAKNIFDPRIRDMFLRLAQEEKEHIQTLQTKIRFIQPVIFRDLGRQSRVDSFISDELKENFFPTSDARMVEKYKSDGEALEYAIDSEKRSINILSQLMEKEKKLDVKTIFSHLIVEEKTHLARLEGLRRKI